MSSEGGPGGFGYDIFRQPFAVLRIKPTFSPEQIADACDDAIADNVASENEIATARQALFTPNLRLTAELSYLIDASEAEADAFYCAAANREDPRSLRARADKLPPLSRSNALAHLAARSTPSVDLFLALVDAHASIDLAQTKEHIDRIRKAIGQQPPTLEQVREGVQTLTKAHCKAALSGTGDPAVIARAMSDCVEEITERGSQRHIDACSDLVRAYGQAVGIEFSKQEEAINRAIASLRSDPDDNASVQALTAAIEAWSTIGKPALVLEAFKGRDDERARSVFISVRSLSIDLANEHDAYSTSLTISKTARVAFDKMPRAATQLSEDIEVLETRIAEAPLKPLVELIESAESNATVFAREIEANGFGVGGAPVCRPLWKAFEAAALATAVATVAEVPWTLVRGLALKLNNEHDSPKAALAIIKALVRYSDDVSVPETLMQRLLEDRRTLERTLKELELQDHIRQKNSSAALSVINELLRDFRSPEERDLLTKLKGQIQANRNRKLFWWSAAAIGLVAIIWSAANDSGKRHSVPSNYNYSNSPPTTTSYPESSYSKPPQEAQEVTPPVGTGLSLTLGNVRYCKFQDVRLDAIRNAIDHYSDLEIRKFNALVEDYNSRCGSFRYKVADLSAVTSEINVKKFELENQGRNIVTQWRGTDVRATAPPVGVQSRVDPPPTSYPQIPPQPAMPAPDMVAKPALPVPDLLRVDEAARVQKRLVELGYLAGPANGTWGPQSRKALRAFKRGNQLSADDLMDVITVNALFDQNAIRGSQATTLQDGPDSVYPPPTGANLNPLNAAEASRINSRLRELGFYSGKSDTVWSPASRVALRNFKSKNSLPADDIWDGPTEYALLSKTVPTTEPLALGNGFASAVSGTWITDIRGCPNGAGGSDALPIVMTDKEARVGASVCDFSQVVAADSSMSWNVRARCSGNGQNWIANIKLVRNGNTLSWSSERGAVVYNRCSN